MTISSELSVPYEPMNFSRFSKKLVNLVKDFDRPLFTTVSPNIFEVYLKSFSSQSDREEHNCRCCKKFLESYGGLVYLDDNMNVESLLWSSLIDFQEFADVVSCLDRYVSNSTIRGMFYTDEYILGYKYSGGWEHFAVPTPETALHLSKVYTPNQYASSKLENYDMLYRATKNYSLEVANQALTLLRSGSLYRAEASLGMAEWYHELCLNMRGCSQLKSRNYIWNAVATAPAGFCNISSSILGTLMDDLIKGYNFDDVSKRFSVKMNPSVYRRPQTSPGKQNIKRGEEIIKNLGYALSLERRYATLEDLKLEWRPKVKSSNKKNTSGVFKDVVARNRTMDTLVESTAPPSVMTFERFKKTIMPHAEEMYVEVPRLGNFSALITAVHPKAPNILQWDNTVNWYVYPGGSLATSWNLTPGSFTEVTGVTYQPNMWTPGNSERGEGLYFLLKGSMDSRNAGSALFPEVLTSELHEVRKTIEAYSKDNKAQGRLKGNASGLKLSPNSKPIVVKVLCNNIITKYILDRIS